MAHRRDKQRWGMPGPATVWAAQETSVKSRLRCAVLRREVRVAPTGDER